MGDAQKGGGGSKRGSRRTGFDWAVLWKGAWFSGWVACGERGLKGAGTEGVRRTGGEMWEECGVEEEGKAG